MSKQILADLDFVSASRILNLLDGTLPQHPATVAQLNAAIEGLAWKDSARVASTANLNLAAPGATIDGVTMVAGDRILAKDQTSALQNGIYIWNAAATPATRSSDTNTSAELEQAVVSVEEGTSAGAAFRQTAINFVLDTGAVTWVGFGTAAPAASETTAGVAELATQAETDTGTDDLRMVTPLKLKTWVLAPKRFQQNIGDGAAAGMTGGTLTKDGGSIGQLPVWLLLAQPTTPIVSAIIDNFDDVNGTHPFVFAQNEGFIIENRVLFGAAAGSSVYIDFSWAEVTAY